jgi:hypothetical protein
MEKNKILNMWWALKEKPQAVDKVWDIIPYFVIEEWVVIVKTKIELCDREDAYSIIVMDICEQCLDKKKISIKQFKCILNYDINYNNNNLKYKYGKENKR